MADMKVYRYDFFDGLLKRERRSTDYATADAIAAMRGTVIAESMQLVDEASLDPDGHILAHRIVQREEEDETLSPEDAATSSPARMPAQGPAASRP